jgi:hypothetical protein
MQVMVCHWEASGWAGRDALAEAFCRMCGFLVIAGLDPAIHHFGVLHLVKIDGYAGQARV